VLAYVIEIDPNGLPSMPCYELTPQGVNGLREFRVTEVQRFLARKKTADFSLRGGLQAIRAKWLKGRGKFVVTEFVEHACRP
jgi:hypothetical protein